MSTALIVANQTLPSLALADAINERIRKGVTAFYVVVPATPITHRLAADPANLLTGVSATTVPGRVGTRTVSPSRGSP